MSNLPVFRLPITSEHPASVITPTFENCLGTLVIDSPAPHDSPVRVPSPASPVAETIDAAASKRLVKITYDRENQRPTHEWNSLEEFQAWRINEELERGIELRLSSSKRLTTGGPLWHENRTYSCSRQGTGGKKKFVRKCSDRTRKQPSKRTGCRCRIRIKMYQDVSTVLGWYEAEHDHAIGVDNLMYTRLRDSTRVHVLNLLRMNMSPKEVFTHVRRTHDRHERGHYITMQDIYRLRKIVKQEAGRSMSSDVDQHNYEHSEGSPINEDEELTSQAEDASEIGSSTEVDEDLNVLDGQSDEYTDSGVLSSPPPGSAIPHLYTAAAGMEFTASPVIPTASVEPTVSRANMESAALPVMPAAQTTHWHYTAPPPPPSVHPLHNMPAGWYMPPPVVVYIPNPPYQMTLYPLYPVYISPPTR